MRVAAGDRPFGVVLLPADFQIKDQLWERAVAGLDRSRLDRDEPRKSIAAGLAERGIPYLDMLPAFRAVPPQGDGDRHCFLVQDSHYNVRGNAVAGRNLAPWLRSLLSRSGR